MNLQAIKQRFGIIGRSEGLDHALQRAVDVAPTDLTVLITGESGVGKEVFSKIIHSLSPRKHKKFIAVNCGAIPEGTINSELFGHAKGAFTGATSDRKGYFETVNGGTIFLDEIGEMPLETQSFLLRILESGEFIPVGSSKVLITDVRVVAATNKTLLENVEKGKFRRDLFYRLSTVPIGVPPLRERKEDIYLLFRKFAADFASKYRTTSIRLDERAVILLENYHWPGNIRELKNVAEQISVLAKDKQVSAEVLIDFIPNIVNRNLPMITKQGEGEGLKEREILYKLLFDMKSDLNDLKSLVFELVRTNDLRMPDVQHFPQLQPTLPVATRPTYDDYPDYTPNVEPTPTFTHTVENDGQPIIIKNRSYSEVDEVEETLSLKDMEEKMIKKALKKHNGRRKDAAIELGISERTLFRKIKQYNIKE